MKNWKVILQSDIVYYFFIVFVIIRCFFAFFVPKVSVYDFMETQFEGTIIDFKIDGDTLSFTLMGKEKLQGYYKIKSEEEKKSLEQKIGYGIRVKITGRLEVPQQNTVPNTFNYKNYLYYKQIYYILDAFDIKVVKDAHLFWRSKTLLTQYIKGKPDCNYLLAFLLGNTNFYDLSVLRSNGISHLFAVSGMHISLFISVLKGIFKKRKIGQVIILLFLLYYGFLVGFTPSVCRVLLFTFYTRCFKHVISNQRIFFLSLGTMLLLEPFYLMDIGFQYSFLISFTFLYVEKSKNYVSHLLKMSFVAFLASLPITAMNFYEVNFLGIFFNLIFVPFVSFLLYPSCFLVLIFPFLNFIFHFLVILFEGLNGLFKEISFCTLIIPKVSIFIWVCYYFIFFFCLIKKKKQMKLLFFILVFIKLLPFFDSHFYVYFMNVGQGDSILFVSPWKKEVFLLDTGGTLLFSKATWQEKMKKNTELSLITFFHSLGISKLSYLILSHGDYDHMGEATYLVENFKVNKVIFNCGAYNDLENKFIEVIEKKRIEHDHCIKELEFDHHKLHFLNTREYNNENDNSNVIYMELNHYKFLFMGDASTFTEEEILSKYKLSDIDVLKVGHHGSKTSSGKSFIHAINPKYSIISVGKNNRYGHPNREVLDHLNHSKIYRTDIDGSIMFEINKDKLNIGTCPP